MLESTIGLRAFQQPHSEKANPSIASFLENLGLFGYVVYKE